MKLKRNYNTKSDQFPNRSKKTLTNRREGDIRIAMFNHSGMIRACADQFSGIVSSFFFYFWAAPTAK